MNDRLAFVFPTCCLRFGAVIMLVMAGAAAASGGAEAPAIRRGPFIQSVLGDKATVLWFSQSEKPGTVRYGLAAEKLDRLARSTVRAMPDGARRKAAFAHEAQLTGLPAGTDIYYHVTDPTDPRGVARFRSDPGPDGTITFICGGDEVSFDPYRPFLQARGIRLDMVLDLGDYQSYGTRYGPTWWRSIPAYIAWGNHNEPEAEKHWWALPGDKVSYTFTLGPAFFAINTDAPPGGEKAAWKIGAEHYEMMTNGKQANNTEGAARFANAGYALRLNGNDHSYARTYPINGPERQVDGAVFLTHGGYHERTKSINPLISNYYIYKPVRVALLPIITVSPQRLEVRVLMHRGETLAKRDWPENWPEQADAPRDYPHEWDYWVRMKDPHYADRMLQALDATLKNGKPDRKTLATVRELGGLVEGRAVAPLTELLKVAKDPALRREIALALDRIGDPTAMAAMKSLARDKEPLARIAVAQFFAKFGDEQDAQDLAVFLEDDQNPSGGRGPATVCPQQYYVEGLMLRIGGPLARRHAPDLLAVHPHYAACALSMLARDTSEAKLATVRVCIDRVLAAEGELDSLAAPLANILGPLTREADDLARLVRLGEKLGKRGGWEGVAAGVARMKARQHVPLLVKGYRLVGSTGRRGIGQAAAIRSAVRELTGLELPDPVKTVDGRPRLDAARIDEGAAMVEEWARNHLDDDAAGKG